MNWKLVFLLSLFGLAMGIATVFAIPSKVEPFCWLAIFVVCAWLIAQRAPRLPFLHGLLVGIVNGVWVTAAHVLLFEPYMARHPAEAEMMQRSIVHAPRLMMLIVGPIVGVISGCILGLFAIAASRIVGRRPAAA